MIVELRSSDDPRFEAFLDLLHRLFPPETREPDEQLRDELDGRRPSTVRDFVWEEDGVRGLCRAAWLSVGTLIVHIGVDPDCEGQGVGTGLLRAVREASGGAAIFAEVEEGPSMAWWRARGAKVIASEYVQPPLRPDTEAVPMALMAIGWNGDPQEAVKAVYGEFYGRGEAA